jgi:hypothetical protein
MDWSLGNPNFSAPSTGGHMIGRTKMQTMRALLAASMIAVCLIAGTQQNCAAGDTTGGGGGGGGTAGGGKIWGSFGALSGKSSPIAPPNASGGPGKIVTSRGQKFQIYNFGRFTSIVTAMTSNPKFAQKDADQMYGWAADIAKQFQLPLVPQPKRGGPQGDSKAAKDYWMKQLQEADPVLEARYGATERYIFDLSMHAHLLQVIYDPKAPKIPLNEALNNPKAKLSMTESLTLVFKVHGAEAMPERIWKPFIDAVDRRAPFSEVNKRLQEMDDQVEAWFLPKGPAPHN